MIKTTAIVGPRNHRWGQTFSENNLYLVVEISEGEDLTQQGHDLIMIIEERYAKLENITLDTVKTLLADLPLSETTTVLIGVVVNDIVYITGVGHGTVFLRRGRKWGMVFAGSGSVSGPFSEADTLLLSSPHFLATLPEDTLKNHILSDASLDEIDDTLAQLLHQSEDPSGASCLIITKQPDTPLITPDTITQDTTKDHPSEHTLSSPSKFAFLPKPSKIQRMTMSVGIVLLIVLSTSLIFGSAHRKRVQQTETLQQVLGTTDEQVQKADTVIAFNADEARGYLLETKQLLEESIPLFDKDSSERKQLEEKLTAVSEKISLAERKFTIIDAPLFFDITWVKEDGMGKQMSVFEDTLAILDPERQSLYTLSLSKKQAKIAASRDTLRDGTAIAVHGTEAFVYVTSEHGKVFNTSLSEISSGEKPWTDIAALAAFGGNLYLLDRTGPIWKLSRLESGEYTAPRNWLTEGVTVDFSRVRAMSIDGNIWALTDTDVLKFTGGNPDVFFLKDDVPQNPKDMYTDEDLDHLYILEDNRIAVYKKDGKYYEQYLWDRFANAQDFVVSNSLKKILVLIEGKIYGIDLK